MTTTHDAKGRATVVLIDQHATGQPPRTYAGKDFPLLTASRGAGAGTWSYYPDRPT